MLVNSTLWPSIEVLDLSIFKLTYRICLCKAYYQSSSIDTSSICYQDSWSIIHTDHYPVPKVSVDHISGRYSLKSAADPTQNNNQPTDNFLPNSSSIFKFEIQKLKIGDKRGISVKPLRKSIVKFRDILSCC